MPETAFLRITLRNGRHQDVTILRNSAHSTISHLFTEALARRPDEDSLTVVPGFLGAYPNVFYRVAEAELPAFAAAVAGLKTPADYAGLANRFAVRRTRPDFWPHLDALHDSAAKHGGIHFGLFDLNRLENR